MNSLLSDPKTCIIMVLALFIGIPLSAEPLLWFVSISALFLSIYVLGWHRASPVLVWIIVINLASIWADVFNFNNPMRNLAINATESAQRNAIYFSSCAIVFLAVGMRSAQILIHDKVTLPGPFLSVERIKRNVLLVPRLAYLYVIILIFTTATSLLASVVPAIAQPLLAIGLLKFVVIYWLASRVFDSGRHYPWLVGVLVIELILGSTGYFASYKEGIYIALIALAANSKRLTLVQSGFAVISVCIVLYMSLVWTVVKVEYRENVATRGPVQSLQWLGSKYLSGDIDYRYASQTLMERIGYTKFYALVLDTNTDSMKGIYQSALVTTMTPRIFFPDKKTLDDSMETAALLGWNITKETSIGLGYVAQAHINFGFPGLLIPMIALGALVGLIHNYFQYSRVPSDLRNAFAAGTLFNSLAFAGNIDKQLGGLIMAFLVLAVLLNYGKGMILTFIEGHQERLVRRRVRPI